MDLLSTLIELTPIKYSADGSPCVDDEAVLTGLIKSRVVLRDCETSIFGRKRYGPSPKNITPSEFVDDDKHIANFRSKLKAAASWVGSPILVRPSPAIPDTPLASPCNKKVGAQENKNWETLTG
ncbi:hypothetical protein HanPI659440_Chr10g0366291 [Helianthus annuus]|nr:hypothetical protein HanPI659440_Chr10g0366291 [Helianthus annuus]